jgi:uncharacterized protein
VSTNPFLVNIGVLRHAPGKRMDAHRSGMVPGGPLAITSAAVPEGAEVAVDAVLEMASGTSVLVTGTVAARWEGDCRRCLGPATGTLAVDVRELYEDRADPEETYQLHGDQLDLAPLVRDAVLLELPLVPLCMEDCRGLCPDCGANRNQVTCSCTTETIDPRWAALEALRGGED